MSPVRDDPRLVETWREILDRHARVTCALDAALAEHGLGMSEYEVLERLATVSKEECRMHELAESIHLSQSALSRVVARLEKDGLAKRKMCPDDRRAIFACVTEEGRARYEAARPVHRRILGEQLERD